MQGVKTSRAPMLHSGVVGQALYARTIWRPSLSDGLRQQMLQLMQLCYDGVTPARFFADLQAKQAVILLYSRRTHALVGFSTLRLQREEMQGRRVEVIFSGDTVIHPEYWGQKTLQVAFGRFILGRKLRHPWRPCVWFLLSKGVKTYLLMVRHFPQAFPRPGHAMPPSYKALGTRLASAWWPEAYDAARGILHFVPPRDAVKAHLLRRDGEAWGSAQPEVAFFLAQNPGYARGDELVCLAHLRVVDILRALLGIARHRGRRLL